MCAVGFGGRHMRSLFNKGAAYNLSLHLSWPINSYSSISSTLTLSIMPLMLEQKKKQMKGLQQVGRRRPVLVVEWGWIGMEYLYGDYDTCSSMLA